jgi:hypothetical protein
MLIPDTFISQGIWWTVRYSDDINNLGETDYDTKEIIIRESLPEEMRAFVFFHEIGHTLNTTIDHALMDSLSAQYFQVLRDNNLWTSSHRQIAE